MRGFLTGWGIRILIIAAIAVGAFILRDRLSSNAGDLAVGDCFDNPTTAGEVIQDVQHVPCNEPHDNEVFVVLDHPAADGAAYPGVSGFDTFTAESCIPQFEPYTGRSPDNEATLGYSYYAPTSEGWTDGDHEVICYLFNSDETKLTAPLKKAS